MTTFMVQSKIHSKQCTQKDFDREGYSTEDMLSQIFPFILLGSSSIGYDHNYLLLEFHFDYYSMITF